MAREVRGEKKCNARVFVVLSIDQKRELESKCALKLKPQPHSAAIEKSPGIIKVVHSSSTGAQRHENHSLLLPKEMNGDELLVGQNHFQTKKWLLNEIPQYSSILWLLHKRQIYIFIYIYKIKTDFAWLRGSLFSDSVFWGDYLLIYF